MKEYVIAVDEFFRDDNPKKGNYFLTAAVMTSKDHLKPLVKRFEDNLYPYGWSKGDEVKSSRKSDKALLQIARVLKNQYVDLYTYISPILLKLDNVHTYDLMPYISLVDLIIPKLKRVREDFALTFYFDELSSYSKRNGQELQEVVYQLVSLKLKNIKHLKKICVNICDSRDYLFVQMADFMAGYQARWFAKRLGIRAEDCYPPLKPNDSDINFKYEHDNLLKSALQTLPNMNTNFDDQTYFDYTYLREQLVNFLGLMQLKDRSKVMESLKHRFNTSHDALALPIEVIPEKEKRLSHGGTGHLKMPDKGFVSVEELSQAVDYFDEVRVAYVQSPTRTKIQNQRMEFGNHDFNKRLRKLLLSLTKDNTEFLREYNYPINFELPDKTKAVRLMLTQLVEYAKFSDQGVLEDKLYRNASEMFKLMDDMYNFVRAFK